MQNSSQTTIHSQIKDQIKQALQKLDLPTDAIELDRPTDQKFGDFSTNVALQQRNSASAQQRFKTPRQLAEAIATEINHQSSVYPEQSRRAITLMTIQVAGPGFINFHLSDKYYLAKLSQLTSQDLNLKDPNNTGKKVIVEYSSPNIAKPFTIGHLRSTIIGDAIANLLEATGWQVLRDNHLGDWGTQFGKQIYAIKTWGNEQEIDQSDKPVKKLVELYVKFHQEAEKDENLNEKGREWFKKLEDGDPEAKKLWQKCVDWSWKEFEAIYKTLGVKFTENDGRGYGESFFEDKMGEVISELKEKKLLKEGEDGAKLVFFPDDKYPPLMILKGDGTTLYATRDLATDKFRLNEHGDDLKIINEVGLEQELYFKQLFEIEQMLGWIMPGQRVHVKHGLYRFKGGKMSTRKGLVIWLEDVFTMAYKRAKVIPSEEWTEDGNRHVRVRNLEKEGFSKEEIEAIAVGAIKWNDLKNSASKSVVFDWDQILSIRGNSGPYVQYTHARAKSVLRKRQATSDKQSSIINHQSSIIDINDEERAILRQLVQFQETVQKAADQLAPHLICTYIYQLAQQFNTFYNKHSILGIPPSSRRGGTSAGQGNEQETLHQNKFGTEQAMNNDLQNFRLALTTATATTLKTGLHLLGIAAPDKM